MTEAQWLAATDPTPMLEFLRGKASARKVWLFAVACCTHPWHFSKANNHPRPTTGSVSPHADDITIACDLAEARRVQEQIEAALQASGYSDHDVFSIKLAVEEALVNAIVHGNQMDPEERVLASYRVTPDHSEVVIAHTGRQPAERGIQAALARDVFGNPFRPVTAGPTWLTSVVLALAGRMYESRDFTHMPILADALQDAGCEQPDVLDHCRAGGQHVRGCWVVDLLLGKS
jgi:anti-sigma regulatory factor (Ser/Thr protein kinase)